MSVCTFIWSRSEKRTRCWRRPRSKSPRERGARAGVVERLGAGHVLRPGGDVDPVSRRRPGTGSPDRDLDVDLDPAHCVDDLPEALEVDLT